MKYHKQMKVGKRSVLIISDSWVLDQKIPGRAIVSVVSTSILSGSITIDAGIGDKVSRWWTGYIERCSRIDQNQVRLVIRELGAVLLARYPMALRNVTGTDVLKAIADKTGLAFNTEDGDWLKQSIPHFINIGCGYDALDLLGKQLGIDDYIWQCQADGSIYVGSAGSTAAAKMIIELPEAFFTDTSAIGTSCAFLPALRPGQRLRIGDGDVVTIKSITVTGDTMRINY